MAISNLEVEAGDETDGDGEEMRQILQRLQRHGRQGKNEGEIKSGYYSVSS